MDKEILVKALEFDRPPTVLSSTGVLFLMDAGLAVATTMIVLSERCGRKKCHCVLGVTILHTGLPIKRQAL
jgi:hypothetical protein